MKYFLIFFVVIFFCSSAVAGACEASFSNGVIDRQVFLRRASEKLERDLQAIKNSPKEPVLKSKGFKFVYYAGVDLARESNEVARYLRKIKADPKRTHIPYFAGQIGKTIAEFERGFRMHNRDNPEFLQERLKILAALKAEARKRIEDQNVTYDWWATFNLRLVIIASEPNVIRSRSEEKSVYNNIDALKTHEEMQKIFSDIISSNEKLRDLTSTIIRFFIRTIESFPQEIMFFTTDKLGIMAFNRLENNLYFVGVSGKSKTVDGLEMSVFEYFHHDLQHMGAAAEFHFPQKILKRVNNISSISDREKAEVALFMYRHDFRDFDFIQQLKKYYTDVSLSPSELRQLTADIKKSGQRVMKDLENRFFDPANLQEVLPDSVNVNNREQVERFLNESADVFSDILLIR